MKHPAMLAVALLLIPLSGCLSGDADFSQGENGQQASHSTKDSASFAGQGQYTGDIEQKVLECDQDGHLQASAQGQGYLEVIVTDAEGKEIGRFTMQGSQGASQQSLSGASGHWTVKVTAGYEDPMVPVMEPQPRSFQGQYAGHVTC